MSESMFADTLVSSAGGQQVALDAVKLEDEGFEQRYASAGLLGRGGMGEVLLHRDRRLGREVALKLIREEHAGRSEVVERFVREACVQGQLEHPAIVPVHDLGLTPGGQPFFTMKRVRGRTLGDVLDSYARRRLLGALSNVCLAIDFAHRRGVVHRDSKPANIMLGEFGEVYVLDWGVAKLTSEEALQAPLAAAAGLGSSEGTAVGSLIGTPGFIAPEQLRGSAASPASDVYALGAILFEILSKKRLNPGASAEQAIGATIRGAKVEEALSAPELDVPPELTAICQRAVAPLAADRFQSAREMQTALERYLDGDRDQEMRKRVAADHLAAAETELRQAKTASPAEEHEHRAEAMRQLTRAIALDPQGQAAVDTLLRLVLEPPRSVPKEAQRELETRIEESNRLSARTGLSASFFLMVQLGCLLLLGVRDWRLFLGNALFFTLMPVIAFFGSRRPHARLRLAVLLVMTIACFFYGRVLGPFILVPSMILSVALPVLMNSPPGQRPWVVAIAATPILIPFLLQQLGLMSPSYELSQGRFVALPVMVDLPPTLTPWLLAGSLLLQNLVALRFVVTLQDKYMEAEIRLRSHAWYLSKLLGTPT